jgi:hypothetical protein
VRIRFSLSVTTAGVFVVVQVVQGVGDQVVLPLPACLAVLHQILQQDLPAVADALAGQLSGIDQPYDRGRLTPRRSAACCVVSLDTAEKG